MLICLRWKNSITFWRRPIVIAFSFQVVRSLLRFVDLVEVGLKFCIWKKERNIFTHVSSISKRFHLKLMYSMHSRESLFFRWYGNLALIMIFFNNNCMRSSIKVLYGLFIKQPCLWVKFQYNFHNTTQYISVIVLWMNVVLQMFCWEYQLCKFAPVNCTIYEEQTGAL